MAKGLVWSFVPPSLTDASQKYPFMAFLFSAMNVRQQNTNEVFKLIYCTLGHTPTPTLTDTSTHVNNAFRPSASGSVY